MLLCSDINHSLLALGMGIEDMECHFIHFCIEFPPVNIPLKVERDSKLKIPCEIIADLVYLLLMWYFLFEPVLPKDELLQWQRLSC